MVRRHHLCGLKVLLGHLAQGYDMVSPWPRIVTFGKESLT